MNLKLIAAIAVVMVFVAAFAVLSEGFQAWQKPRSTELRVAYLTYESVAPFLVAQDRGYFEQNGLNVTAIPYTNGAFATEDVLLGRADIAIGPAEYPVVAEALANRDVRVVGVFDKTDIMILVVRNDTGVRNISDLRGKRIGYTPGTMTAFTLDRYLSLHGLSQREIVPVVVDAGNVTESAATGRFDAVLTLQPYADQVRAAWNGSATMWHAQGGQPVFGLIITNGRWAERHPATVRNFLTSLDQGIQYTDTHTGESFTIVRDRIGLDPEYLPTFRDQNQFGLSLDRSLLAAMEDEARWMIAGNLTGAKTVPDFRPFLYTEGLAGIKPGSVNVMR